MSSSPSINDLISLSQQLERDRDLPLRELEERDHSLSLDTSKEVRDQELLQNWLRALPSLSSTNFGKARSIGLLLLGGLSLIAGLGSGMAMFRYDGTHPINILPPVATILIFQVVSLVVAFILMKSSAAPDNGGIGHTLRELSPGRWLPAILRLCSQPTREAFDTLHSSVSRHRALFTPVYSWSAFHASQWASSLFFAGLTLSFLRLVLFTDLAFAWSTTLDLQPSTLHSWTSLLTAPVSLLIPSVSPSLDLVSGTRYFRLEDGGFSAVASMDVPGSWWPFVLGILCLYGVLPRLLCLAVGAWKTNAQVKACFTQFPGASDVIRRLRSPIIETITKDDQEDAPDSVSQDSETDHGITKTPTQILIWNEAQNPFIEARQTQIGGRQSWEQDIRSLKTFSAEIGNAEAWISVKAWEPPTADLVDLLKELRPLLQASQAIRVVTQFESAPSEDQFSVWQKRLAKLGDPYLQVVKPNSGGGE